jgi:hypothetical protein
MMCTDTNLLRLVANSDGRHGGSPQAAYEAKVACSILYLLLVNEAEESFKDEICIPGYTCFLTTVSLDPPLIPWLIETLSSMRSKDPVDQAQRYPKQVRMPPSPYRIDLI